MSKQSLGGLLSRETWDFTPNPRSSGDVRGKIFLGLLRIFNVRERTKAETSEISNIKV